MRCFREKVGFIEKTALRHRRCLERRKGGAVFYQEMDTFAPAQWVAFVVSFCILTFGVLLINKSEAQRAQDFVWKDTFSSESLRTLLSVRV